MRRLARITLLAVCALAALVAAGCNKEEQVHLAATEGIYVTVDDLKYQIQISRILNPAAPDDEAYLNGLPTSETLQPDEVWYGIFMRVENDTDEPHEMASQMTITDTQGNTFEPIQLDPAISEFGSLAMTAAAAWRASVRLPSVMNSRALKSRAVDSFGRF